MNIEINNLEKQTYKVNKIIEEAKGVVTIQFIPEDENGEILEYKAGQFIRVDLINNHQNLSGKPYSISSTPKDSFISISVKKIGQFSGALHELKVGDSVEICGPFGSMSVADSMKKIVFITGGIGIAPFYSMIKDLYERGDTDKEIHIFYSNKTKEHIAFYEQLEKMEKRWSGLHITYFLTKTSEQNCEKSDNNCVVEYSRINTELLKKYLPQNLTEQNYFLCGTVSFVTDMSKILEVQNIDEKQISAELFY